MASIFTFDPPVIAHRGARSDAPENTLAALRLAREQGANWVEFDVKITQDGVPILMHDETLERTTNGAGAVAETDWNVIAKLDAGKGYDARYAGEAVPRLSDALRVALECNLNVNLELKPCLGRALATTMVALIEASRVWPDSRQPPLLSSFDVESLVIAAQFQPHWPRSLLLDAWREDWRDLVTAIQASAIGIDEALLTPQRVVSLAESHLPILAYTVNDPARAKELLGMGVSAVFADNPREMIAQL